MSHTGTGAAVNNTEFDFHTKIMGPCDTGEDMCLWATSETAAEEMAVREAAMQYISIRGFSLSVVVFQTNVIVIEKPTRMRLTQSYPHS